MERTPSTAVKATLLLASSLTVLAGAIVAPALPSITAAFADEPGVELLTRLIVTLPALAIAIVAPCSGWVIDRLGRVRVLVAALVLYAAAGTSGVYLGTLTAVLVGRALLGVAVAFAMTAATTLIGDLFAGPERTRFLGQQAAFMSLGGVAFVTLGGALAGKFGWHAPFWVYLAALPVAGMAFLALDEPARAPRGDISPEPLVWRVVVPVCLVSLLLSAAFYLGPVQLPYLVQRSVGATPLVTGLCIAVITTAGALVGLNFGAVAQRLTRPSVFAASAALMGLGWVLAGWITGGWWTLAPGLVLAGLGSGGFMPNASGWLMSRASESARGRVVGLLTASIFLGQFVSPLLVTPIATRMGLGPTFVGVGVALVGAALAFATLSLRSTPRTDP
jgi:MFS family permease